MPSPLFLGLTFLALYLTLPPLHSRLLTLGFYRGLPTLQHGLGEIHLIHNTINAEDLHYHAPSGMLFTACQGVDGGRGGWFPPLGRYGEVGWAERGDGGLRVIDPKTLKATRLSLENFTPPFTTHGISLLTDPYNPLAIFIHAVNHLPSHAYLTALQSNTSSLEWMTKAESKVEIFYHVLGTTSARHIGTVGHDFIQTPNDLHSTGPYSFFVTNDHRHRSGFLRKVEDLAPAAAWSSVVHVEARVGTEKIESIEATVALRGLHNANGLSSGRHPDEILINSAAGGTTSFARILPSNKLELTSPPLKFSTTIDNPSFFVDPWPEVGHNASGILNAGLLHAHALEHETPWGPAAPVVHLSTQAPGKGGKEGKWTTRVLFQDDGKMLRSASAAVMVGIDPKENGGRKEGWLFVTGFLSKGVIAVKVAL